MYFISQDSMMSFDS